MVEPVKLYPESEVDEFAEFWSRDYPHPRNRGSKKDARKLWDSLTTAPAEIRQAARIYAAYCDDPKQEWYHPQMATTWLRGENWEGWLEEDKRAEIDQMKFRAPTSDESAIYEKAHMGCPEWVSRDEPVPEFVKSRAGMPSKYDRRRG